MSEKIRGTVARIVDGDSFDLEIDEVMEGDQDQFDDVERVRIASLDVEIDSHTTRLEEGEPVDEEETTGTPEEAAIDTGKADPTRFYGIRDREDLEARILGADVECRVIERNEAGELVAEVSMR